MRGFNHDEKADAFDVAMTFANAAPADFDGLLLPGGVMNGDQMRMVPEARAFAQAMQKDGKPIAVICHGGWLLVSAGMVKGRTMTSPGPRCRTISTTPAATGSTRKLRRTAT